MLSARMTVKSPVAKKHGKKYAAAVASLSKNRYPLAEAVELLPKVSTVSFDATAELHVRIAADMTKADQLVRTSVVLPHGTGKSVRIAAFVPAEKVDEAKQAGADRAGLEDLIEEVQKGTIDFEVAVALPEVMKNLGKVAKILGQRGLMPNPKSGTITQNLKKTIEELKKGRVECKMDTFGIIHVPFGKVSFGAAKLKENLEALLHAIKEAQPSGIKGLYITSVSIAPTMGPGIRLEI